MRESCAVLAAIILLGTITGCRSGGNATPEHDENKTPVIVEINGSAEHQSDFERFVKSRLSDFAAQNVTSPADNDQLRSRLLDEFIRRQLIVREALNKKIEPTDDEIRQALEAQHKQTSAARTVANGVDTPATLESSERRIEIFNDLLTLKFYQTEVLKNISVTPQEVENYYNLNRDRYQGKNGFYVREVRVYDEAEAQKVYRQALAKPADFAVLAKEHSEAPTADNGGLIYYEAQQLPPVLEQAISVLKVGTISRVVKSSYGYHIFKLEQRAEPLPLEKVRQEIEEKLISEKNQALVDQYNKQALSAARINIYRDRLGFNYVGNLARS